MSGLLGLGSSNASTPNEFGGYQVQTSIFGSGIPIIIGTAREAGNVLWIGNWVSTPQGTGGKGGGKGSGGSKGSGGTTITFTADFIIGICQGPINTILSAWQDKTQVEDSGSLYDFVAQGLRGQGVWGFLLSNYIGQAIGYSEIAFAGFENVGLGSAGNLSNYSFEISGPAQATAIGWIDALVSDAIYYILTNFNCMNFPTTAIGDMTDLRVYCLANVLNVSPVVDAQDTAQTILQELLLVSNSEAFSSEGVIKFATYGDKTATGSYSPTNASPWGSGATGTVNLSGGQGISVTQTSGGAGYLVPPLPVFAGDGSGMGGYCILVNTPSAASVEAFTYDGTTSVLATIITDPGSGYTTCSVSYTSPSAAVFNPPMTPDFDLTYDDFITDPGGVPIKFSLSAAQDATNDVFYEWLNRARQYNTETVSVQDDDSINKFGLNIGTVQTIHSVKNAQTANNVASVQLKRSVYMLRKAQFTLGWSKSELEPMDIVTVPEEQTAFESDGVTAVTTVGIRLLTIEEDDKGNFACEGEVLLYPILNPSINPSQVSGGYTPGYNANPADTLSPMFLELPPGLSNAINPTQLTLAIFLSGGSAWGGCGVYVSTAGPTGPYTFLDQQTVPSVIGFLTSTYPFGSDPDIGNILEVNLQPSQGEIDPGNSSKASANGFSSLALVDQEIISYAYVELTGPNLYSFETSGGAIYNRRGVFSSDETKHVSGAPFALIDGNQFYYEYSPQNIGSQLWFKFPAFNKAGQQIQDLSAATVYPWTLTAPYIRGPLAFKPFCQFQATTSVQIPFGYTYGLYQEGNFLNIFGTKPVNSFSTTLIPPTIPYNATPSTGGSIPVGSYVLQVCAVDSTGKYTLGSNLIEVTTTSGNQQVTFPVTFPPGTSSYEVFIGTSYDTLQGTGIVSGAPTTITVSAYTSIVLGYGPPDNQAVSYHAKGKQVIHAGIASSVVVASNSVLGTVVIGIPTAPTLNEFANRILVLGQRTNSTTTAYAQNQILGNDTGSPNVTLKMVEPFAPSAYQIGDLVYVSTASTAATATSITDTGLVSPWAPSGLTPHVEIGNMVRVIWDPTGASSPADPPVVVQDNTSTVLTTTEFLNIPGNGTMFIVEAPTWTEQNSTTVGENTVAPTTPASIPLVTLPVASLSGEVVLVEVTLQNAAGNDSTEYGQGFRIAYIVPPPSTVLNADQISVSPYNVLATDQALTFVGGSSIVNLPALATVIRHTIYLLNDSGSDLTLNPAAGDTIWGQSFYTLTSGSIYQILPNV